MQNFGSIESTPLIVENRRKINKFNNLTKAFAGLSFLLLCALIATIIIMSNNNNNDIEYETSLIAVLKPTILNACTGCDDPDLCNLDGLPEPCVQGWVRFDEIYKSGEVYGAHITGNVSGFYPHSVHAWHVHISADIGGSDEGDGFSLGGHFNPENEDHGCPYINGTIRHVGDLGNVVADENGYVIIDLELDMIRFIGKDSINGRSLIFFQDKDECTTMASGYRWGAGVIGVCPEPDCQDKYLLNSTSTQCFFEDWECGDGVETPYDCCAGLKCEIEDEINQIGTCIIDPTR